MSPDRRPFRFKVRTGDEPRGGAATERDQAVLSWPLAAVGAGLLATLSSWVLVTGVVVLGWLTERTGELRGALRLGTDGFLLAHGAGADIGAERWTLVPLGLTALFGWLLALLAGQAAGQLKLAGFTAPGPLLRRLVGATGGSYVAAVTLTAMVAGTPRQAGGGLLGAGLLALLVTGWVGLRALGIRLGDLLPPWTRGVGTAVGAGLLALVVTAALTLVVGLVTHHQRVTDLSAAVGVGPVSALVLTLGQVLWLPNLLAWSGSFALGAGFSLGDGSLVSPAATDLGVLPALPVLGALPAEGGGSWWSMAWLLVGVVSGVVVAVALGRRRTWTSIEHRVVASGLAGVLTGLGWCLLGWLSGGDMGSERLVGLGPRLPQLALLGCSVIGLSAMVAGLLHGLLARRSVSDDEVDAEETVALH